MSRIWRVWRGSEFRALRKRGQMYGRLNIHRDKLVDSEIKTSRRCARALRKWWKSYCISNSVADVTFWCLEIHWTEGEVECEAHISNDARHITVTKQTSIKL